MFRIFPCSPQPCTEEQTLAAYNFSPSQIQSITENSTAVLNGHSIIEAVNLMRISGYSNEEIAKLFLIKQPLETLLSTLKEYKQKSYHHNHQTSIVSETTGQVIKTTVAYSLNSSTEVSPAAKHSHASRERKRSRDVEESALPEASVPPAEARLVEKHELQQEAVDLACLGGKLPPIFRLLEADLYDTGLEGTIFDDCSDRFPQSPLDPSNFSWQLFDDTITPTEAKVDSELASPASSYTTDSEPSDDSESSEEEQEQLRQQKKAKINPPQPTEQPEKLTPHRSVSANFNHDEVGKVRSIFDFDISTLIRDPEWLDKLIPIEKHAEEDLFDQQAITEEKIRPVCGKHHV